MFSRCEILICYSFKDFDNTRKLKDTDSLVFENQQHMQNDSFEFGSDNVCRTS